jgi:hypothetical protein
MSSVAFDVLRECEQQRQCEQQQRVQREWRPPFFSQSHQSYMQDDTPAGNERVSFLTGKYVP